MKNNLTFLLALLFSFSTFAQELGEDFIIKNEEITNTASEIITGNDSLNSLEENRELILDDSESDLDIIRSIPADAWALVKAPIGWTKREWFIAGGVVTITSMLMVGDHAVQDFFQRNRSELSEDVSLWAERGGSQAHVGLAASYLVGTILKNKKLKKASLLAFSSMLISGVLVQGLKHMFGRTRPFAAQDQWQFNGPQLPTGGSRNLSFPSGHTASAFSVAASIATIYDSKLVKILAYSAATLTGLSRIHDNKHWMSDVFMGAVLGTVTGIFVTRRHMNNTNSRIQVAPTILNVNGQSGYGVGMRINLDQPRDKRCNRGSRQRRKRCREALGI